jgi:hypothetical protein
LNKHVLFVKKQTTLVSVNWLAPWCPFEHMLAVNYCNDSGTLLRVATGRINKQSGDRTINHASGSIRHLAARRLDYTVPVRMLAASTARTAYLSAAASAALAAVAAAAAAAAVVRVGRAG